MSNNLASIIEYGKEERNIEFKEDQNWKTLKFKIIKTCIALSNLRDGGFMVIGMKELGNNSFERQGISSDNLKTYIRDTIAENINNFAEPSIGLDTEKVEVDGKDYLFIIVREFSDTPTICKRDKSDSDGNIILKKGTIYYRPAGKIETVEIKSYEEMKELIDLSILKGVRNYLAGLNYVGIKIEASGEVDDEKKFKEQRGV